MTIRKRSQSRILALQALCLFERLGPQFEEELSGFLRDPQNHVDLDFELPVATETLSFARELAAGAWHGRVRYDELLTRAATEWSLSRMTPVDRNILRLGLHELLGHAETPPEVVLDEAIALAHRFSSADAPAFVNAVLDACRRDAGVPLARNGNV